MLSKYKYERPCKKLKIGKKTVINYNFNLQFREKNIYNTQ